jgi:hypothetical protein
MGTASRGAFFGFSLVQHNFLLPCVVLKVRKFRIEIPFWSPPQPPTCSLLWKEHRGECVEAVFFARTCVMQQPAAAVASLTSNPTQRKWTAVLERPAGGRDQCFYEPVVW